MNAATLDALVRFPDQLAAHYAAIPAGYARWAPASWEGVPSEPLTAIEQLCHVHDIEIEGYHVRIQRTLTENNPTLAALDTDALVRVRHYRTANAAEVLAAFRAARAETIAMISALRDEQLNRRASFEGYGPVTLRGLLHYLCSHDQQHLSGLQWLLGRIEADRATRT